MRFKQFKGSELRYDIQVNGVLLAADVSKKYRNGRYVNIRLNPKGECWGSRNYMFTGDPHYPFEISKKTIAAFYVDNNGEARPVLIGKEKKRNESDATKLEGDWMPYALALHQRIGGNE